VNKLRRPISWITGSTRTAIRSPRLASFVAATALHLLLFLLAFAGLSGAVIPNAGDPLEDTDVVLVTLAGRTSTPSAQSAAMAARFDQLLARIQAERGSGSLAKDKPSMASTSPSELDQLMKAIGANVPSDPSRGQGAAVHDRGGRADLDALLDPATSEAKSKGAQTKAKSADASSGALWGAIEPCWKQQKGASRVPVTIEISLNGLGQLAKPPTIIRPVGAQLDEARLVSEARAIGAIAACAPLHVAQLGSDARSMRVEFRP
jgi:hypothetical protein